MSSRPASLASIASDEPSRGTSADALRPEVDEGQQAEQEQGGQGEADLDPQVAIALMNGRIVQMMKRPHRRSSGSRERRAGPGRGQARLTVTAASTGPCRR